MQTNQTLDQQHPNPWYLANRDYCLQAIGQILWRLEQFTNREGGQTSTSPPEVPTTENFPPDRPPALEHICQQFGLSSFERQILLLCAGVEINRTIAALCAANHKDPKAYATLSLAMAVFGGADWRALSPKAPLRRWHLIEPGAGPVLTHSPLRINERILHELMGVPHLDHQLEGILTPLPNLKTKLDSDPSFLPPSHQELAQRIALCGLSTSVPPQAAELMTDNRSTPTAATLPGAAFSGVDQYPAIQLCGGDYETKWAIAAAACAKANVTGLLINTAVLPTELSQLNLIETLLLREVVLTPSVLILDCESTPPVAIERSHRSSSLETAVNHLIESLQAPFIMFTPDRRSTRLRRLLNFDIQPLKQVEQQLLWRSALAPLEQTLNGAMIHPLNGYIGTLISYFNLSPSAIEAASQSVQQRLPVSAEAADGAASLAPEQVKELLWGACLAQARPHMEDLAQWIQSANTWQDLVLPDKEKQTLRTIATHVRQRAQVYERWGFAVKSQRGLGISALFVGESGTGKTLAAEVLANELNLNLYRIDLSTVVSKYIGETEKNLRRVFDAAETGGAILLFDEADALFGKRSDVKDSHDRYANMEVAYLLQRIEAYRGLAILTTNMKAAIDQAFLRRIRFISQFPFPNAHQRAEIWRRVFPPDTPTQNLAFNKLAKLNVSGGNIRNIALNAAFLAAEAGEPVQMKHLLQAAQSEYIKLEKPLTDVEVKGWIPKEA
ncbi:MAG: ATP-binding protein [Pseudanabaenales cyanobacterium]|nr:ATP-binding protein [Pseudanabaenales cyanobacterium]